MTTTQIRIHLKKAGKPVSVPQLYRYFTALNIRPLGARQRPQLYPANAPELILAHLGFAPVMPARATQPGKILSLKQIKARAKKGVVL